MKYILSLLLISVCVGNSTTFTNVNCAKQDTSIVAMHDVKKKKKKGKKLVGKGKKKKKGFFSKVFGSK
tara:strand:- start:189 stop:392 length:204 start_codon:yes stop_codon:yes gene_type:complete